MTTATKPDNVAVWFEIPAADFDRAVGFYEKIFETHLTREKMGPASLAQALEVSERTIYRDVRDLSLSGVPIEGEAGVGYALRRDFDLPPLMFDYEEIEALTAGARMVQAWSSPKLARAAQAALDKIAAALPTEKRIAMERTRLYAPTFHIDPELGRVMDTM